MSFIKQCKGFDSDKIALPAVLDNWYWSIKYDGHYMQVHVKQLQEARFFTSSGKEFYEVNLANDFMKLPSGIYECEFLGYGDGRHGGRKDAAFATTLRTEFAKGIKSNYKGLNYRIFDIIDDDPFEVRLRALRTLDNDNVVEYNRVDSFMQHLLDATLGGWEGIYLKSIAHRQLAGKRVKQAIKLKQHPTADVVCFDIELGTGKYTGMIGSLVCKDENGVVVKVGSGLTDSERLFTSQAYLGKTIEIGYESFSDTYIHPVFKGIRNDK